MLNNDTVQVPIDAYRIRSASGALNRNNWWGGGATGVCAPNCGQSIHDQNITGFPVGNGTGNGWEEGPGSTNNELVEWYLGTGGVGSSMLGPGQVVTMNNIFQIGGAQDLQFEYRSDGLTLQGVVQYIGGTGGVTGDFNGNGAVDAADYVLWRNGDALQNEGGITPGAATPEDYNTWRANFGRTPGAGSSLASSSAVPEPASWFLALLVSAFTLGVRKRSMVRCVAGSREVPQQILWRNPMANTTRQIWIGGIACVAAAYLILSGNASASTLDRNYRLGDDAQENAAVGGIVGQSSTVADHTLDSASQGSFFDIMQHGNPTYVNTQSTGRPGAAANERGIQFTGSSSQYLSGTGLGSPREVGPLANPPITNYPNSRLMQVWVRPTDTGARQEVISDTFQFGIFIADNDMWGHTYGSDVDPDELGDDFVTDAPVAYGQWTHVMQQTFDNDGVALYVNGVAVSRINADYEEVTGAGSNLNLYIGAGSGGASNFFTGQLDDVKLHVAGIHTTPPPIPINTDWGAVNLGTENDFIASRNLVAGDVNGDGVVNGDGLGNDAATDDVRFFIDHWLDERRVNNIIVGDLTSRTTMADLNFDGRTTLSDWSILRNAHAGGASLDLASLIGSSVPEPSTLLLIGMGAMFCGTIRRSH
jgi:hypothetical protein